MELRTLDLKSFFFIAILLLLGGLMLQILSPFVNIIIIALIIVQQFHPVYLKIHSWLKNEVAASLLTTAFTLVAVVVPVIIITLLTATEISNITSNITITSDAQGLEAELVTSGTKSSLSTTLNSLEEALNPTIDSINNSLSSLGIDRSVKVPDLEIMILTLLRSIEGQIVPFINGLISFGVNALAGLFMLIITLIYTFIGYEKIPYLVSRISPLDDDLDRLLIEKFTHTNKAVVRGSFVVAIAQATSVSIALAILGIGAPVLLWVLMVFLSLIPVGSGVVWLPIGIGLILTGQPVAGILLIIYSAVVINVIDTSLRPYLLKGTIQLHPLIIIFSAIGGISLFGPLGILYGPLVAVFFTSLMDVYTQRFASKKALIDHG